jgi:hypothetical protein
MPVVHFLPFEVKHKAVASLQGSTAATPDQQASGTARRDSLRAPTRSRKSGNGRKPEGKTAGDERCEGEEDPDLDNPDVYLCPVYKTSVREGVLTTTGQSTNYILSISLPIDSRERNAEHWTLRGTAIISMLAY